MKTRSEKSIELLNEMRRLGYDPGFCELVTYELNTDYTATRMLGYLSYNPHIPPEDVADEMLAILGDRERWVQKKEAEHAQAKLNYVLRYGFEGDEEE